MTLLILVLYELLERGSELKSIKTEMRRWSVGITFGVEMRALGTVDPAIKSISDLVTLWLPRSHVK